MTIALGWSSSRRVLAVTTYPMSDADREIQERARRFVDEELIPLEVETELSGGKL